MLKDEIKNKKIGSKLQKNVNKFEDKVKKDWVLHCSFLQ